MKQEINTQRLAWNVVYKQFVNLIKFSSKTIDFNDQMMEASDVFQEGQIILYDCWLRYGNKSLEEFTRVFKASLWNKIRSFKKRKIIFTVDLDSLVNIGEEPEYEENGFNLKIFEDKTNLKKLVKLLKDDIVALTILREFLYPTERTLWEIKMDLYRRETYQKYKQPSHKVPKSFSPTKQIIMRSLELPSEIFNEGFLNLKKALKVVYNI